MSSSTGMNSTVSSSFATVNNPSTVTSVTDSEATLGDMIRRARDEAGLTQVQLAERIGIDQRTLSETERGLTDMPRFPTLKRIAQELRLDLADLYIAASIAKHRSEAKRIIRVLEDLDAQRGLDDAQMDLIKMVRDVQLNPERETQLRNILQTMLDFDRRRMVAAEVEEIIHARSGPAPA